MKLLILGGTVFVGRAIVESALAQGHEVTIFNRGKNNPELFPEIEKLRGDRDGDLGMLRGRRWDAVIDTCGYVPRIVRSSVDALADAVEHYTFVSTISVYGDSATPGMDESAAVDILDDPHQEQVTGETYGPLKVLCEQTAEQGMPGRVLVVRPGLIVGPHDPTDRFTYWCQRVAAGGEVLAPEPQNLPVQVIDVRDLAAWLLRMAESRQTGIYHATGPAEPLTMQRFLELCKTVTGSDAHLTWVSAAFLQTENIVPWVELPLWIPPEENGDMPGLMALSIARALAAGLELRPLEQTIRDTAAWNATRSSAAEPRAGLSREREQELLRLWHAQQSGA